MSRLSRLALSKRSVTLLFAGALFIAGVSAWGSLKQELLPDIDFPVITVVTPYPGAGSSDVDRAGDEADRERHQRRAAARDHPVDLVQLDLAGRRPVLVRDGRQGDDTGRSRRRSPRPNLPASAQPTVQALNINASPVVIASIAATGDGRPRRGRARSPGRRSSRRSSAIEGVARADVTGGLEQRVLITLDPAKLAAAGITSQQIVGVLQANNLTLPSGQLPTDGSKIPVSTIGTLDVGRADRGPRRRLPARAGRAGPPRPRPPAGSAAPSSGPSVAPSAAPVAPTPITIGDLGTVEPDAVATTGYGRTNGNPALTADRLQDLEREHGRGRRRRPGQARRDRQPGTRTS